MKWPERLTLVRHGESDYNALKKRKEADPLYRKFKSAYDRKNEDPETARALAQQIIEEGSLTLTTGDHDTALTERGQRQAQTMAAKLRIRINVPQVVFVSPYTRTHHTLDNMVLGWPELGDAPVIEEERIREQEHGLLLLYNDSRIFQIIHPEQERLREKEDSYWYRYPQGESVPDVRLRLRSWLGTLTRDYQEQSVLAVTHHLSILSLRANLERLDAHQFRDLDEKEKPINCGVTIYRGNPDKGEDGKLELIEYNAKLY